MSEAQPLIDFYNVGLASVRIVDADDIPVYIVDEPSLTEKERENLSAIMSELYSGALVVPEKITEEWVREAVARIADMLSLEVSEEFLEKSVYYIMKEVGYGKIDVLMKDENVEEISCPGYGKPVSIVHRKLTQYDWIRTNVVFETDSELLAFLHKLAYKGGRNISTAVPYIDVITPENHRIALILNDISRSNSFSIRKHLFVRFSIVELMKLGMITPLMSAYLWLIIDAKGFVMVAGPTGSGKTTLINAIASFIPDTRKVCTIEDTHELELPHSNWEALWSRTPTSIAEYNVSVDLLSLVKTVVRLRPDNIILGEIRGEEAKALFQAAAVGHGCISSMHAGSVDEMITRLQLPPMNVDKNAIANIWSVVMVNRLNIKGENVRKVTSISEISGTDVHTIFVYDPNTGEVYPDDTNEIVKVSRRLAMVAKRNGWDRDRLELELRLRKEFLEHLVERNVTTIEGVMREVSSYRSPVFEAGEKKQ